MLIQWVRRDLLAVIFRQDGVESSPIPSVGDSAAVVAFTGEILQCLERHVVVLIEKNLELKNAYPQIGLVELIRCVPTDRPELSSLLHYGVKKAQTVEKLLEYLGLFARLEEIRIADRIAQIRPNDVRSKTLRRFVCHFDAILENGYGKMLSRVTRQPETKIRMYSVRKQALAYFLQRAHPTLRQMTILQNYPVTGFHTFVYQLHRYRPLTWLRVIDLNYLSQRSCAIIPILDSSSLGSERYLFYLVNSMVFWVHVVFLLNIQLLVCLPR